MLIFRRWKISVPFLLIAIGASCFVLKTAKPDYIMTSYVQLIPARVAPADTDNPAGASLRNPWNQLGLNTLGQASIYATQDKGFLESLKATKHTDNFTLTMTYPNPIVTVEVVGSSPADATETTQLVVDRLRASAQSLQTGAGVGTADLITMQRLDQGQNLSPSRSKVKRAILAVAAAGLMMTAGGTLGLDALARRRSRKRKKRNDIESPAPEIVETSVANGKETPSPPRVPVIFAQLGQQLPRPIGGAPAERPVSPAVASPPGSVERTAIVVTRTTSVAKPPATSTHPPAAATYQSANAKSKSDGENDDAAAAGKNGKSAASSDVRVVLQPKRLDSENGGKS